MRERAKALSCGVERAVPAKDAAWEGVAWAPLPASASRTASSRSAGAQYAAIGGQPDSFLVIGVLIAEFMRLSKALR